MGQRHVDSAEAPDRKRQAVRIVLVEDEPLIAMSMETFLTDMGDAVAWVSTDRAAYALLERQAHDTELLIADIDLGEGTTGYDVSRFARRLNPDLAVIYLSGNLYDTALAFGVERAVYLTKPISAACLERTIAQLLVADPPADQKSDRGSNVTANISA